MLVAIFLLLKGKFPAFFENEPSRIFYLIGIELLVLDVPSLAVAILHL